MSGSGDPGHSWDHGTHQDFFEYYASQSESETALQRFRGIQAALLRIAAHTGLPPVLDVADVGCGAGTQARLWAERAHRVHGLDVNEPLIALARQRAANSDLTIDFQVGTATDLPWADGSMDVCLLPELLEHVDDWESCVKEATRVLRPGGILYLSTTNVLCPVQEEFHLPMYSWYPRSLKRYCERLAKTTKPHIAGYAKYPAVHWFSFYSLRAFLEPLGFRCLDRFDLVDPAEKGSLPRLALALIRTARPIRFLGHVATPYTHMAAVKSAESGG